VPDGDLAAPHNARSAGTPVPLLRDYTLNPLDVHAAFPGDPRASTAVRALVDFLVQGIKRGV
jgi:DNA-binding transcriptional LysR family regulator